jgi:hypothetical protein
MLSSSAVVVHERTDFREHVRCNSAAARRRMGDLTVMSEDSAATGPGRRVSRRAILLSAAGAVLVGGAAGGGVAALRPLRHGRRPSAPVDLLDALAAEDALIAALDAMAGTNAGDRILAAVRADHVAHQAALRAFLSEFTPPPNTARSAPTASVGSRAELARLEQRAADAAAGRAARLSGSAASVLASIAACESTHVVVLA